MTDALTESQATVADRVLDEESRARRHLVVHLSGAHAYGFASPDSDLDLKAIHIEPTKRFLGLTAPQPVANRLEIIDGVEIDYTSNEIEVALRGVLKGDGNMLERITSDAPLRRIPELDALRELCRGALSRRYHRHYRGFAGSQRRAAEASERPIAKKVLYVLRTTLTGAHLLETGACVPDLTALADDYGFPEASALIELKRSAEKQPLPDALAQQMPGLLDRAFRRLDEALTRSPLPEEPPDTAADELEAWLIDLRQEQLSGP